MAYVFISSRMSELEAERLAAFHACHRLGHRPMMFEMQPTAGGIQPTVNHMVENADYFIGIVRDTLGTQSFDLESLPPILYELGLFVSGFCPAGKGREGTCGDPAGRQKCLVSLHNYLRGRCLRCEVPAGCESALRAAREKLIMLAAEPMDERTVSTQLEAFLAHLRAAEVPVAYFGNHFDLFAKIVEHPLLKSESAPPEHKGRRVPRYLITYEGTDHPGQVYELAADAFGRRMNIECLSVRTEKKNRRTHIAARVVPYVEPGSAVLTAAELQESLAHSLCDRASAAAPSRVFSAVDLTVADADESIVDHGEGYDADKELAGVQYLKVRIHHLNVPGIVARISQMLAGKNKIFPYPLNIERCAMLSISPSDELDLLLYGTPLNEFASASQNLRAFQVCDLLLTDAQNGGDGLKAKCSAGIYELENALSSIAGVDYVVCSDWIGVPEVPA